MLLFYLKRLTVIGTIPTAQCENYTTPKLKWMTLFWITSYFILSCPFIGFTQVALLVILIKNRKLNWTKLKWISELIQAILTALGAKHWKQWVYRTHLKACEHVCVSMWLTEPSAKADITLPRDDRDLLMFLASSSTAPSAPVLLTCERMQEFNTLCSCFTELQD